MALDETRARLIDAAGREFAEKGYEGATVRAICDRAGVNLAAINYHFGDKERLYEAVLLVAHRSRPARELDAPGVAPQEALRRFIGHFLEDVAGPKAPWHQEVMAREIASPSKASDVLVREAFRPGFEHLCAIIRQLVPNLDQRQIHAAGFSVVAQCLHYKMSRSVSERIIGAEHYARLEIPFLVDHITRFTLAALGHEAPLGEPHSTRSTPSTPEGDR